MQDPISGQLCLPKGLIWAWWKKVSLNDENIISVWESAFKIQIQRKKPYRQK